MSECDDKATLDEEKGLTEEALPPLGIRHLLLFTTGIAVALGIISPIVRILAPGPSVFASAMIFLVSIRLGLASTILGWTAARAYLKKPLPIVEPGAKFALILSSVILILTALTLIELGMYSLDFFLYEIPAIWILRLGALGCFAVYGVKWINETPWRVVVIAQALGMAFCLFPISSAVGGAALIFAFMQDLQTKRSRHWTHYFGILLWVFSQFANV